MDYNMTKEQKELFEANIGLAYYKADGWLFKPEAPYERDDILIYALEGLALAAKTYSPDKEAKFATYASIVMKNRILRSVRSLHKFYMESPNQDPDKATQGQVMINQGNDLSKVELDVVMEKYLSYCEPMDATIFREIIINDRSRVAVAKMVGVSHQTVSTRIKEMQLEFINFMNKK